MQLRLTKQVSLGHGTRPAGFVLGEFNGTAGELISLSVDEFLPKFQPAEGVQQQECAWAFNNLAVLVEVDAEVPEEKPAPQQQFVTPKKEAVVDAAPAWSGLPVETLAVEPRVIAILKSHDLKTLGSLSDYARDNDGFTKLPGIGEQSEESIVSELAKHLTV